VVLQCSKIIGALKKMNGIFSKVFARKLFFFVMWDNVCNNDPIFFIKKILIN